MWGRYKTRNGTEPEVIVHAGHVVRNLQNSSSTCRGGWKLVISDARSRKLNYVNDVTYGLPLWSIVKGELDLNHDALACLGQNSLSGYC